MPAERIALEIGTSLGLEALYRAFLEFLTSGNSEKRPEKREMPVPVPIKRVKTWLIEPEAVELPERSGSSLSRWVYPHWKDPDETPREYLGRFLVDKDLGLPLRFFEIEGEFGRRIFVAKRDGLSLYFEGRELERIPPGTWGVKYLYYSENEPRPDFRSIPNPDHFCLNRGSYR